MDLRMYAFGLREFQFDGIDVVMIINIDETVMSVIFQLGNILY